MKNVLVGLSVSLVGLLAACGPKTDMIACPVGSAASDCDYIGDTAIQQAIDAAKDGGTVVVRAGLYKAMSYRDAPFQEPYPNYMRDVSVRGMLMVEGKTLSIVGEGDVQLLANPELPTSAVVVHDGGLTIENISLSGFRVNEPEDTIYDGHGVFIMDSDVTLKRVRISDLQKMAIVVRGDSKVTASDIYVTTSHMGLWLEETSSFELHDSKISDNHTGLGIYGNTRSTISDSVVSDNSDDGFYVKGDAVVTLRNVSVSGNSPYGINIHGGAKLIFQSGTLENNIEDLNPEAGSGAVVLESEVKLSKASN